MLCAGRHRASASLHSQGEAASPKEVKSECCDIDPSDALRGCLEERLDSVKGVKKGF